VSEISDDRSVSYRRARKCQINNCLEVGRSPDGRIFLRNTRAPHDPPTIVDSDEWSAFLLGAKEGDFDSV